MQDQPNARADRLWARVDRRGPDECWPWRLKPDVGGYGEYAEGSKSNRYRTRAHRVAWELTNGPIPDGLLVCHHCDNRTCCNPAHLFLGTHADNTADMMAKGRHWNPPRDGEHNGNSKLTDAQRAEIIETFHRGGVTKAALSRRYGVTDVRISQIILRAERG